MTLHWLCEPISICVYCLCLYFRLTGILGILESLAHTLPSANSPRWSSQWNSTQSLWSTNKFSITFTAFLQWGLCHLSIHQFHSFEVSEDVPSTLEMTSLGFVVFLQNLSISAPSLRLCMFPLGAPGVWPFVYVEKQVHFLFPNFLSAYIPARTGLCVCLCLCAHRHFRGQL